MTIEQIIKYLPAPMCGNTVIGKEEQKEYDAHDSAVIILRKYQKIEQVIIAWENGTLEEKDSIYAFHKIIEVVEDGNNDN